MKFFYTLGIRFYGLAILVASIFNEKARKWRQGRKDIFTELEKAFSNVKEPVAWFHCSSLGEFEQGRPVVEAFGQRFPQYKILLTFFSPSGYEVRKNYSGANYIFYLPLDTASNAGRFVKIVKPKLAVFVKYEFWFNYLQELHKVSALVYLISAKFRPGQYFFKGYATWFRRQLKEYKKIFVQDAESEKLLRNARIENVVVGGDTRFDRVITISQQAKEDSLLKIFKGSSKLWICGSTWPDDEKIILQVFKRVKSQGENVKLLLVPHEIGEDHVTSILREFQDSARYTTSKEKELGNANVLVIDKMGLLSSLYSQADIAYVGGGFGKGIHNLPEAAVYGIPVLFGPNYQKFNEAFDLIQCKGGASVANAEELLKCLEHLLNDDAFRKQCGDNGRSYIFNTRGATDKIMEELSKTL